MIDSSKTAPNDAAPFAVRLEDTLYVKLVHQQRGILTLTSINKVYEPILINLEQDDYQIIGAVV